MIWLNLGDFIKKIPEIHKKPLHFIKNSDKMITVVIILRSFVFEKSIKDRRVIGFFMLIISNVVI